MVGLYWTQQWKYWSRQLSTRLDPHTRTKIIVIVLLSWFWKAVPFSLTASNATLFNFVSWCLVCLTSFWTFGRLRRKTFKKYQKIGYYNFWFTILWSEGLLKGGANLMWCPQPEPLQGIRENKKGRNRSKTMGAGEGIKLRVWELCCYKIRENEGRFTFLLQFTFPQKVSSSASCCNPASAESRQDVVVVAEGQGGILP